MPTFDIISSITQIERIATSKNIRDLNRLQKLYGLGQWRKMKGLATIRFSNGLVCLAEIHWYEAQGIGRKEFKIKEILEEE